MKTIKPSDLKIGQVWQIGKAKLKIVNVYGFGMGIKFGYCEPNKVYEHNLARFFTLAGAKLKKEKK